MPIQKLRPTFTFDQDRIAQLRALAPEAFADGKINWDVLKEAVGENLEDESPNAEHFGLFWPGKREARRFASKPSSGTLIPAPGEGVDEEKTHNIFIEGDNLEVLKLLQKSYAGQVKMIYIDPPYNTGNDFVYEDNFTEPLDAYLKSTGQRGFQGESLTTNTQADGRFHSNWLNMMYPRLRLARDLLREDGLIFVSIDDNEIHNLREMMNEVFGEENFVDNIIWKKRYGGGSKEKYLITLHEYILFFAKDKDALDPLFVPTDPDDIDKYYKLKDEKYEIRGPYRTHPLEATKSMGERKNLIYPIPAPDGTEVLPKRQWLWSRERAMKALASNELEFMRGKEGWTVHTKQYLRDEEGKMREAKPFSIIDNVYTQHGTNEIIEIFGDIQIFSFPKPTGLVTPLLQIGTSNDKNDLVLDFFAGSATTAHAIMKMNNENCNRRFILVQLPEATPEGSAARHAGYGNIAEIGEERIRRVSKKLKKEEAKGDLGFRVFKLAPSNFKQWRDYDGQDLDGLETQFAQFETPLVDGWTRENLLTEILLQQGFPLDSALTPQKEFTKNEIVAVASPASAHKLFVCLDEKIHTATIQQLKLAKRDVFICLDAALSSEAKVRLGDATNLVVI